MFASLGRSDSDEQEVRDDKYVEVVDMGSMPTNERCESEQRTNTEPKRTATHGNEERPRLENRDEASGQEKRMREVVVGSWSVTGPDRTLSW